MISLVVRVLPELFTCVFCYSCFLTVFAYSSSSSSNLLALETRYTI
ncbi:MAG: hypothetical protein FWG64_13700 [Firmicutes bacterium]|nr:hypothetical protein [Bacillota bacterium]